MLYPVTPKTVKERVAVWKIVLAVLAGIILLALLIFGLYKVMLVIGCNRLSISLSVCLLWKRFFQVGITVSSSSFSLYCSR